MTAWIQTFTGMKIYPLRPDKKDVCILDIAHALSNMCRFNGHCNTFYSVAQHSIYVYEKIKEIAPDDKWLQSAALLHDAAEAYLPDICRPIKSWFLGFQQKEEQLLKVIFESCDLDWPNKKLWNLIKIYDDIALVTEARDLLDADFSHITKPSITPINPMSCFEVKCLFLDICAKLHITKWVQL